VNSKPWRLIDTGPLPGAENMAIDESLLCLFKPGVSDPILRIYGWNPPSLSLGRFQNAEEVLDVERCRADSMPVIRRVSGGGVIYHADELTYSIVCSPEQISSVSSVKESFRILTGFLINFYHSLNLNASYALDIVSDDERLGARTAFCFAGKESFDILIDGKKIGGNAQRRNRNVIFQHGSIPMLNQALTGLGYMRDRSPVYAQGITSLRECGVVLEQSRLKRMLVEAFNQRICMGCYESPLSNDENRLYQQLLADKYTTDSWNLRGEVV
jgi:lipoate-protein ligase A